jgi:DNA repair protein RadA/Sms
MRLTFGQPKVNLNSNILDIDVPAELEHNIPTGMPHIDCLFAGDGIMPSTSALVTGQPGLGKSTLMLQLADSLTGQGHSVLYVAGEESLYQIRKAARRLNLQHGFVPTYDTEVNNIIAQSTALQKKNTTGKVFVFVDSLQCLYLDNENAPKANKKTRGRPKKIDQAQRAIELLTMWAKDTFGVVFMIGHVTKDGSFAGKNSLKHTLDCHLHLEMDTERGSETYGQRIAIMKKNRSGISEQYFPYECTAGGLQFAFNGGF